MSTIEYFAVNGAVVAKITISGHEHFVASNVHGAHDQLVNLSEAIGNAQGQEDALTGKVKTPTDCPRCKARNVTPRHVCKRGTPRTGR